jgi:hypothetical protein
MIFARCGRCCFWNSSWFSQNYIPEDVSYDLNNFEEFFEKRKLIIKNTRFFYNWIVRHFSYKNYPGWRIKGCCYCYSWGRLHSLLCTNRLYFCQSPNYPISIHILQCFLFVELS